MSMYSVAAELGLGKPAQALASPAPRPAPATGVPTTQSLAEVDQILPEASAEETPGTGADRGDQGGAPAAPEGDDALIDASEISVEIVAMQQSISEKQGAASAEEILERLPKIYANLNEDSMLLAEKMKLFQDNIKECQTFLTELANQSTVKSQKLKEVEEGLQLMVDKKSQLKEKTQEVDDLWNKHDTIEFERRQEKELLKKEIESLAKDNKALKERNQSLQEKNKSIVKNHKVE
ncbi:hypothetical protein PVAP13_4NG230630 [Panicum virgatum]|uniref:Uncharacterized protein n=1 Tax=Panicum virgatum TaxID=38727 RepID=A0A8T0TE30_PANVG|nr:hypothetical protein PVAP13_4NG230630 [Panicum virgatum]